MNNSACWSGMMTLLVALAGCSAGSKQDLLCSRIQSEIYIRDTRPERAERLIRKKDAAGGELVIEFRKDDVLGKPTHRKKCSFFLEPSRSDSDVATIWTANHCLDIARDSKYRLRFYVDFATGYQEIPVEFEQLELFEKLRQKSGELPAELQREFLNAFRAEEVDFSRSKNGRDICLNSFNTGPGWSKFHEPIKGNNQVSCFLYHDLALLTLKLPAQLSAEHKNLTKAMLKKAHAFDEASITYPNANITSNGQSITMGDFRKKWLETYRTYTTLKEKTGFARFAREKIDACVESTDEHRQSLCEQVDKMKAILTSSGFEEYAHLLTVEGNSNLGNQLLTVVPQISELWKLYTHATVTENNQPVQRFKEFNLVTNYSWNGGQVSSFSAIPLLGFFGLGWGTTTDQGSGDVRERVGAATYHWIEEGAESFIYAIIPKQQTTLNLNAGYGQLRLTPGDSGSLILADGLPMAVLATVDGEKTSGGSALLPLPEIGDEPAEAIHTSENSQGASIESNAIASASSQKAGKDFCLN